MGRLNKGVLDGESLVLINSGSQSDDESLTMRKLDRLIIAADDVSTLVNVVLSLSLRMKKRTEQLIVNLPLVFFAERAVSKGEINFDLEEVIEAITADESTIVTGLKTDLANVIACLKAIQTDVTATSGGVHTHIDTTIAALTNSTPLPAALAVTGAERTPFAFRLMTGKIDLGTDDTLEISLASSSALTGTQFVRCDWALGEDFLAEDVYEYAIWDTNKTGSFEEPIELWAFRRTISGPTVEASALTAAQLTATVRRGDRTNKFEAPFLFGQTASCISGSQPPRQVLKLLDDESESTVGQNVGVSFQGSDAVNWSIVSVMRVSDHKRVESKVKANIAAHAADLEKMEADSPDRAALAQAQGRVQPSEAVRAMISGAPAPEPAPAPAPAPAARRQTMQRRAAAPAAVGNAAASLRRAIGQHAGARAGLQSLVAKHGG